jgi:hypothetical protein
MVGTAAHPLDYSKSETVTNIRTFNALSVRVKGEKYGLWEIPKLTSFCYIHINV